MEPYVSGFLKSAIIWLLGGTTLGAAMAIHPSLAIYRTAHLHMLLLGFVSMFIIGVAYHVIPRFSASPLRSPRLAQIHLVIANLGLALMVTGFSIRVHGVGSAALVLATGGVTATLGMWCFAWNIWFTLARAPKPRQRPPNSRPLTNAAG